MSEGPIFVQGPGGPGTPDALKERVFYEPKDTGAESEIAERLAKWRRRRDAES